MVPEHLKPFTERRRVLDHGWVALLDVMGSDEDIEAAARLSYEGERQRSDTRALLRYLMRHRHTSPFEQACIRLDIRLPIFVARQLVRHRMQSLNEVSARYSELPADWYFPEFEQVCYQSGQNKQGREGAMPEVEATLFCQNQEQAASAAFSAYKEALDAGVARETARLTLPVSTYTHWHTRFDLHNLFHMLGLRLDKHAQWEIRQYAEAIADIVKAWVPLSWEAFEDFRLHAVTFSRPEMAALRELLSSTAVHPDEGMALHRAGLSKREREEFVMKLGIDGRACSA